MSNTAPRSAKSIGNDGERIARAYLERKQWQILTTNFRTYHGEVDLVAREPDGTLVFIEVKTRFGAGHGGPAESVDPRKIERLRTVAAAYLALYPQGQEEPACRYDILEIRFGADGLASVALQSGAFS